MEREMREEFAFHVEMEARKLEQSGMPSAEAARVARVRFGNRTMNLVQDFGADLRHTFRQFRRRPAFSARGITTLALGRGVGFDYLAERSRVFRLAAYSSDLASLRSETGSTAIQAGVVSAGLVDVLGARPALGRTFVPGEDRPGAEATVVLSYGVWQVPPP